MNNKVKVLITSEKEDKDAPILLTRESTNIDSGAYRVVSLVSEGYQSITNIIIEDDIVLFFDNDNLYASECIDRLEHGEVYILEPCHCTVTFI